MLNKLKINALSGRNIFLVFALFLLAAILPHAQGQNSVLPKSKIINAKNLLKDAEILSADDMQGRAVGSAGSAKAREYLLKRFKDEELKAFGNSYLQEFDAKLRGKNEAAKGVNIVGFIKGKKTPEKYIVISAHYDHVGVEDGEIYNGADDNASGTSALLALAGYFKKNAPAYSLVFAAFDAEETGLQGARHFVANPPVKKEDILLNINMDMVSRSAKGELYAVGTFHYPLLKPYLESVQKNGGVKLLLGHDTPENRRDDWTFQSDHFAFHQAKIPFIYFGVEDHADYHRPTDDFANIDQEFYVKAVETILSAVKEMDKNLK